MASKKRKVMKLSAVLAGLLACTPVEVQSFYLPGSMPRTYAAGDSVALLVNALTPQIASRRHVQSLLPYDYYDKRFHFCRPGDGSRDPQSVSESLGSVLFGDRLYESRFEVSLLRLAHNAR